MRDCVCEGIFVCDTKRNTHTHDAYGRGQQSFEHECIQHVFAETARVGAGESICARPCACVCDELVMAAGGAV